MDGVAGDEECVHNGVAFIVLLAEGDSSIHIFRGFFNDWCRAFRSDWLR